MREMYCGQWVIPQTRKREKMRSKEEEEEEEQQEVLERGKYVSSSFSFPCTTTEEYHSPGSSTIKFPLRKVTFDGRLART